MDATDLLEVIAAMCFIEMMGGGRAHARKSLIADFAARYAVDNPQVDADLESARG